MDYYFVMNAEGAKDFIDDVVNNYYADKYYTNPIKENLIGFDQIELNYYLDCSETSTTNQDKFYFNNAWHPYN